MTQLVARTTGVAAGLAFGQAGSLTALRVDYFPAILFLPKVARPTRPIQYLPLPLVGLAADPRAILLPGGRRNKKKGILGLSGCARQARRARRCPASRDNLAGLVQRRVNFISLEMELARPRQMLICTGLRRRD